MARSIPELRDRLRVHAGCRSRARAARSDRAGPTGEAAGVPRPGLRRRNVEVLGVVQCAAAARPATHSSCRTASARGLRAATSDAGRPGRRPSAQRGPALAPLGTGGAVKKGMKDVIYIGLTAAFFA